MKKTHAVLGLIVGGVVVTKLTISSIAWVDCCVSLGILAILQFDQVRLKILADRKDVSDEGQLINTRLDQLTTKLESTERDINALRLQKLRG